MITNVIVIMKIQLPEIRIIPAFNVREVHNTICRGVLTACFMLVLSFGCDDGSETTPDPEYGPTREVFFGEELALVQEISFKAEQFTVFGDLRIPPLGEKHPVILMLHGSGEATRNGSVPFEPIIEIFLRNGFAVLSWDKPGSGKSTGEFSSGRTLSDRAIIVLAAIQVMQDNASIDGSLIGLWGISQAGWVMSKVLESSNRVSFMIVVGGGAEDSIEQFAYLVGQVAACAGETPEKVEDIEKYWSQMIKALNYTEYRDAADFIATIPSIVDFTGLEVSEENEWTAWPRDIDAFFDPMDVMKSIDIPVLVFYGELDRNIDPVQGASAYQQALDEAGNEDYRIEVLQGAGHILFEAETGCLDEFVGNEYVPEYLEILEDWISTNVP